MTLSQPGTQQMTFRLSNAYVAELDRLAEKHHISRADVLRVAVVAGVVYQREQFEQRLDEVSMYRGSVPAAVDPTE